MPFTPSHAVVALPFARSVPGLAAAVAVGAMTPDLPLFVRGLPLTYAVTHSAAWLPLTTVVAAVLLALWWIVLRPAVRELSPGPLAERLPEDWDGRIRLPRPGRTIPVLVFGLAIGVVTHIAWDAFTHEGRAGVVAWGLDALWGPLPAYKWLQYGSSLVGLAVLAVAAAVWLRHRASSSVTRILPGSVRIAWWLSLPVVLALACVFGLAALGPLTPEFTVQHLAYRVLPPAVAVWALASVVLCIVVQLRRRAVAVI
jgi:hypothetical protein